MKRFLIKVIDVSTTKEVHFDYFSDWISASQFINTWLNEHPDENHKFEVIDLESMPLPF